jgi:hypothetical protein
MVAEFENVGFTTALVEKMKNYVYSKFNEKYTIQDDTLFSLDTSMLSLRE